MQVNKKANDNIVRTPWLLRSLCLSSTLLILFHGYTIISLAVAFFVVRTQGIDYPNLQAHGIVPFYFYYGGISGFIGSASIIVLSIFFLLNKQYATKWLVFAIPLFFIHSLVLLTITGLIDVGIIIRSIIDGISFCTIVIWRRSTHSS